jgi:predicted metal-dependent hydrolase
VSNANGHTRRMAVEFGRRRIEYALRYSTRTTLGIEVNPDLSVVVIAPAGADDEAVRQRVRKRAAWIIEQQRFFETYLPSLPPRRYVSGESHRYLGRQYRLRVHAAAAVGVKLARGQLNVGLADVARKDRVRPLVRRWLRARAEAVFGEQFDAWAEKARRHSIEAEGFQIRQMKNRWGSCTPDGHILLNPDLIVAPVVCIEYVVAHELCHLTAHGPRRRCTRSSASVPTGMARRVPKVAPFAARPAVPTPTS